MAAASIKAMAAEQQIGVIYLTGAHMGEREKQLADRLKELVNVPEVTLVTGEPVLTNPEAVEAAAAAGAIVLMEQAGSTSCKELAQETKQWGKKLWGAILCS